MKMRAGFVVLVLLVATVLVGCGGETKQGEVVNFGQSVPAGGGMVQSFVSVETADGEELTVWLPVDDAIWDDMRGAARSGGVMVEFEKDGDFWMWIGVVDE